MNDVALDLRHIYKSFDGVSVLSDVNLTFKKGRVIGLIGANGAGKSTLLNIIWGAFPPDSGTIIINGHTVKRVTPEVAQQHGMSIIFQHRRLMPFMTVGENIFIDNMPKKHGLIDYKRMHAEAQSLLDLLGLNISSKETVANLSTEDKQLVEIVKAYSRKPEIMLMDEPTTALRQAGVERMFELMTTLKNRGCSIVFISHRLQEVMDICDEISILRNGKCIVNGPIADFSIEKLVHHMSGTDAETEQVLIDASYTSDHLVDAPVMVEANHLCVGSASDVNFKLRKGEIIGLAGLGGSGMNEVLESLFGMHQPTSGHYAVRGKKEDIRNPQKAISLGIGFLPEDRQLSGEFLDMSVMDNVCISEGQQHPYLSTVKRKPETKVTEAFVEKLSLKTNSIHTFMRNLSGGNQQKAIIAKWLHIDSEILIMNEPTAGIDVAAKTEIFKLIRQLADEGKSVLCTTSYINEMMGIADRIIVMFGGQIVQDFDRSEFDSNAIYLAMNGVHQEKRSAEV